MAVTGAALARPPRPAAPPLRISIQRLLLRRPELPAAAVVAVAWLALLAAAVRGVLAGHPAAGMAGMPGMGGIHPSAGPWAAAGGGLPGWVLMTVAMMGPVALAGIRHTGLNSLRWRRGRAMAGFAAAYLAVWAAFGALALAATAWPDGLAVPGPAALAAVLAAAAAWQLCPAKRRSLRACHRSVPLPPRGWRAEWGSLRFGLRNGAACLGSCWCLMLVMVAAPAGQVLWTVGLAGAVAAERLAPRPRAATRFIAVACAFAAVAVLATADLLR
jgi:predicted metal-binding membrane protein